MSNYVVLQYSPLQSFVSPTFWHKLAEIKLNHDRLSDAPKRIFGYYTNREAKACLLEVDYTAFNSKFQPPKFCHNAAGTLYNKNTIEEFKMDDKNALLQMEGRKLLADFRAGNVLDDPSLLARFFVFSFADLGAYNYYYWFAFPCPLTPTLSVERDSKPCRLQDMPTLQHFNDILRNMSSDQQNFFILKRTHSTRFYTLKEFFGAGDLCVEQYFDDVYFCFADASEYEHPSWLMRVYAAFILYQCPYLADKRLKFLGLRYDRQLCPGNSLIWNVVQTSKIDDETAVQFVGWEPNRNGKMGPRMVAMRDSMDPTVLAESAVILNLKLMKWRLVPDLNLDIMSNTKCLLFGAGTLGCSVARNLLAWGFKQITLLDSGHVNFSNPMRQNLYTHADAMAGNAMKAQIAAERLKDINPSAVSTGYVLHVPMPGHTIGASLIAQTNEDIETITSLVQQHDVIFLLTDSRESRWLPTLLGRAFNKIVINVALGFDSYLVMRHGVISPKTDRAPESQDIGDLKCISGADLGCYFCNDVTAPGNSLKDRTLDQICTVTRPGVSNIASAYAVELLVSLLQHPQRELAPAYYCATGQPHTKVPEGILGIIPHSIRGMLFNYENILPATRKFSQCIACSEKVLAEYRSHGKAFLLKAFETAKYLEDLTGISDFNALDNAIIDFEDSDFEMSNEED